MTKSTSEQNAAATVAAKNTPETAKTTDKAAQKQKLRSRVVVFNGDEIINVEDDGQFDLDITGEDVTGTHSHPASHRVTGKLKNGIITLTSNDGIRKHVGTEIDRIFIGIRKPLGNQLEQEEGVWVGTKLP